MWRRVPARYDKAQAAEARSQEALAFVRRVGLAIEGGSLTLASATGRLRLERQS